jgi:dCMP deaminase
VQAAYSGTSVKDSTMYVTTQPCVLCAKLIINAGITKIIFKGDYPDSLALELLQEAGVRVIKYEAPSDTIIK